MLPDARGAEEAEDRVGDRPYARGRREPEPTASRLPAVTGRSGAKVVGGSGVRARQTPELRWHERRRRGSGSAVRVLAGGHADRRRRAALPFGTSALSPSCALAVGALRLVALRAYATFCVVCDTLDVFERCMTPSGADALAGGVNIGPTLTTNVPARTAIVRAHDRSNMPVHRRSREDPNRALETSNVRPVTAFKRLRRELRASAGIREERRASSRDADLPSSPQRSTGPGEFAFQALPAPACPSTRVQRTGPGRGRRARTGRPGAGGRVGS